MSNQNLRTNLATLSGLSASSGTVNSGSNNFLNDQITSPTLHLTNEVKPPLFVGAQVSRTVSSPSSIMTSQTVNKSAPSQTQNRLLQQQDQQLTNKSSDESKRALKLGNYLLFESQSVNDSFGTAINTDTNQTFYWKVCKKNGWFLLCFYQLVIFVKFF